MTSTRKITCVHQSQTPVLASLSLQGHRPPRTDALSIARRHPDPPPRPPAPKKLPDPKIVIPPPKPSSTPPPPHPSPKPSQTPQNHHEPHHALQRRRYTANGRTSSSDSGEYSHSTRARGAISGAGDCDVGPPFVWFYLQGDLSGGR
ncbi:hypothetical protein D9619_013497 [Psilocybe cf. subviscida]|uniref:Uncharacterized protein n=1 Tax=Psilocybe cf. subviscida TaxID=2480587 RepID=A0A8H5BH81_9AGAR|nr:hypothetical protein D9619_013497 [Psilocybe cf. subviscida]